MILLSLLTASAAEVELLAEAGSLANRDPAFVIFGYDRAMPSLGFATAIRPTADRHVPVALVASWHHSIQGAQVYTPTVRGFAAGFSTDSFSLGPRLDVDIGEVFSPYLTAQGMVVRGVARFDDNPSRNDNPGQTRYAGLAPGLLTMGGVEFSTPDIPGFHLEFVWRIELGYGLVGSIDLGDAGAIKPGGLVARTGMGVRFGRSGR